MSKRTIECPKCGHDFSVEQALSAEIEDKFQRKYERELQKQQTELERVKCDIDNERKALAKKQRDFEQLLDDRLLKEKSAIEKKLRESIANETQMEVEDLRNQIDEKCRIISESQKSELELRRRARELEEREGALQLELERKLDSERSRIEEMAIAKFSEDSRLKAAEKDKQLDEMRRQIEDLKRKAEQGSQQTQGEVLELEIEAALQSLFPGDQIDPVAKGQRGGDIIHKVVTATGLLAGTIVWETKRTRAWSDSWIEKLKTDQRAIAAEFAVIVTQVMPKDSGAIALLDGVWVVDFRAFRGLAMALRAHAIQLCHARSMAVGKGEKLDFLFGYLTGTQFKQRMETIVESFQTMKDDLDRERRTVQKAWASREQQLQRVVESTVCMYGDIQGIVGTALPKIQALEFDNTDQ